MSPKGCLLPFLFLICIQYVYSKKHNLNRGCLKIFRKTKTRRTVPKYILQNVNERAKAHSKQTFLEPVHTGSKQAF